MFNRGNDRTPGIIPAYAGNTLFLRASASAARDHPRVCGEHASGHVIIGQTAGSSPRMRGTRIAHRVFRVWRGIIPAYAGNTVTVGESPDAWRDHPRVCGEHLPIALPKHVRQGSSPRMRGTLAGYAVVVGLLGIIPAYAGNTMSSDLTLKNLRDHPRVCGEHTCSALAVQVVRGSSPRMRGTPNIRPLAGKGDGIIPAYAGNTKSDRYPFARSGDHPRVCGEHK